MRNGYRHLYRIHNRNYLIGYDVPLNIIEINNKLAADNSRNKQTVYKFEPIGFVKSCFKQKFATPRQAGLVPEGQARICLYEPYANPEAFRGLDQCSHLWLQFVFHQTMEEGWSPRVRPPRLGGNKRLGVFATRSTHRPNPIGLSAVKLESIELQPNICLRVSGIDLVEGTPILDIKPYLPYADAISSAENSIAPDSPQVLPVTFSEQADRYIGDIERYKGIDLKRLITQVLQQDPRPAYQAVDETRLYGVQLMDLEIKWRYLDQVEGLFICVEAVSAI